MIAGYGSPRRYFALSYVSSGGRNPGGNGHEILTSSVTTRREIDAFLPDYCFVIGLLQVFDTSREFAQLGGSIYGQFRGWHWTQLRISDEICRNGIFVWSLRQLSCLKGWGSRHICILHYLYSCMKRRGMSHPPIQLLQGKEFLDYASAMWDAVVDQLIDYTLFSWFQCVCI